MKEKHRKSELSSVKDIVFSAFEQLEEKTDCRIPKGFFIILMLFLGIKGRINFLQLGRFSDRRESGFRYFFEKRFNFMKFNQSLTKLHIKGKTALAFDPSYISKAGRKTPGAGYFWSGCAGKAKWGLEFCGFAVIDIAGRTAFHLTGFQTMGLMEDETLLDFYSRKIIRMKDELLKISRYIAADAYFSKSKFIHSLVNAGFHLVSRLRDDADLQYLFAGEPQKGRGRPKKYDGKIDFKNLKPTHAREVANQDKERIYSLKAYSKTIKATLNLVIVYTENSKGKWSHKIYFSTDLEQEWQDILEIYRLRFQIEFLYRGAKQFTGLNQCEARSRNKLNFHWNMSLTAINIAKIAHWLPQNDNNTEQETPFSMSDVKTHYYNELLLNRFIAVFGINPELDKNKHKIKQLLDFGKIAA